MTHNKQTQAGSKDAISQFRARWKLIQSTYSSNGITLRDYQTYGIQWMLAKEFEGHGALLGDEPGLGKTYQSLALVLSGDGPSLVLAPASILQQWMKDAEMLVGKEHVYLHHGSNKRRTIPPNTKMVLTTPHTLLISNTESRLVDLQGMAWERVIIDEIQCIKNKNSKLSKCVKELIAKYKWGLTGTPVQNTKGEIINLFKFVFQVGNQYRLPKGLQTHLRDDFLRRKKVDKLNMALPEIENVQVEFISQGERDFYRKVQKNVKDEFQRLLEEDGVNPGEEMAILFELLLRLRQVSQHPQLVIDGYTRKYGKKIFDDWTPISSKHQSLLDNLATHREDASIVFCQFTKEMNILQKLLTTKGYRVLRLDGSMCQSARQATLDKCTPNIYPDRLNKLPSEVSKTITGFLQVDVILIQIKAGGVGLNLQSFNRVYITSPDWNPANEEQAIARSWRLGQKKKVYVKRLVLCDELTDEKDRLSLIDDRILSIQGQKKELYSELLNDPSLLYNGKFSKKKFRGGLSKRDIKKLIR